MSTLQLAAKHRFLNLQTICRQDNVSILFILGIDGKYTEDAKILNYLFFGATGKALVTGSIIDKYDFLEELVLLIQPDRVSVIWNTKAQQLLGRFLQSMSPFLVQYTYSQEEESDVDLFQVRKCVHFKRMLLEAVPEGGRIGLSVPSVYESVMEIESWPLIQSFALSISLPDGSLSPFNTSFFTAHFKVLDYTESLKLVYAEVDLFATDAALRTLWSSAVSSHNEVLRLADEFNRNLSSDMEDVSSPLEILFEYGDMQSAYGTHSFP